MRTFLLSVLVGTCVGFGTFMGTDMGTDAGDESQRGGGGRGKRNADKRNAAAAAAAAARFPTLSPKPSPPPPPSASPSPPSPQSPPPPPCPSFTDMKAAHTKLCAANVIDECWDTYVDGGVLDGVDIEGVCSRSFPTDCNCDGDVDVAGSCAQLESNVKGFFFRDSVCDSRFSRCRGNAPAALVEYCRESLVAAKRLIK